VGTGGYHACASSVWGGRRDCVYMVDLRGKMNRPSLGRGAISAYRDGKGEAHGKEDPVRSALGSAPVL